MSLRGSLHDRVRQAALEPDFSTTDWAADCAEDPEHDADPARAVLEREQRDLLGQSGRSMLRDLVEPLGESLAALPGLDTGSVGVGRDAGSYFSLGQARIAVTEPHQVARHPQLPFDVVLYASIAVAMLNTEPTQWGGGRVLKPV